MKRCRKCGEEKPETPEHFNLLPSGNFRGSCKECMRANTKRYYYNDPQRVMERAAKYKRQKEAAGGYCSASAATKIRAKQKDGCAYCGVPLAGGGELDHKTPVSRGGTNVPENMAWARVTCNRDKHNKTAEEFLE
jgi:5-methylcytosine-specific restriction endonuclease McrA